MIDPEEMMSAENNAERANARKREQPQWPMPLEEPYTKNTPRSDCSENDYRRESVFW
jgi:hypothetical protein